MNRRGLSLVELLGAIVIFSLVVSLASLLFKVFLDSNRRISENAKANSTGAAFINVLENAIDNLSPTNYSPCGENCLIIEKEFTYEFDTETGTIEVVQCDPVLRIELVFDANNDFLIDGSIYEFPGFIVNDATSITYQDTGDYLYLVVDLWLENANGNLYNYRFSDQFELLDIPE